MNRVFYILILFLLCPICMAKITDEVADKLPRAVMQPDVYKNYNFESTLKIPIKVKIIDNIESEFDVYEGQFIDFKVARDVFYNEKLIIKRGTPVLGKVSTIVNSGMNGIPASIIFSDFEIEGIDKSKLSDSYEAFGQDRSLFVFPLKWALTPLPPTGSLTNFIKGGHAKVKSKKPFTIYYYPEWK